MKTIEVVEASQLGLAPGFWPATVVHLNTCWRYHRAVKSNDGELQLVVYYYQDRELHVIND
jgi:hypothetical protein